MMGKGIVMGIILLCVFSVVPVFAAEAVFERGDETWAQIIDELVGRATGLNTRHAHFIILHSTSHSAIYNGVDSAFHEFYLFLESQGFFQSGDRISYVPFARHVGHGDRRTFYFEPNMSPFLSHGSLLLGPQTRMPPGTDMEEPLQVVLEELYASDEKYDYLTIIIRLAHLLTGDRVDGVYDGTGIYHSRRPYLDAPWGIRYSDLEFLYTLGDDGRFRLHPRWREEDGRYRLNDSLMRSEAGVHRRTGDTTPYIVERTYRGSYLRSWFNQSGGVVSRRLVVGDYPRPQYGNPAFYLDIWFPDNISDFSHTVPINRTQIISGLVPDTHFNFNHRIDVSSVEFTLRAEDVIDGMVLYISSSEGNLRDILNAHELPADAVMRAQNVFRFEVLRTMAYDNEMAYSISKSDLIEMLGEEINTRPFFFSINPIISGDELGTLGLVHDIQPLGLGDFVIGPGETDEPPGGDMPGQDDYMGDDPQGEEPIAGMVFVLFGFFILVINFFSFPKPKPRTIHFNATKSMTIGKPVMLYHKADKLKLNRKHQNIELKELYSKSIPDEFGGSLAIIYRSGDDVVCTPLVGKKNRKILKTGMRNILDLSKSSQYLDSIGIWLDTDPADESKVNAPKSVGNRRMLSFIIMLFGVVILGVGVVLVVSFGSLPIY